MLRILPALQAHSFAVNGDLKNAPRLTEHEVSLLPIQPFMPESDVKQVLATCNSWTGSKTSCTPS